ncbi:hypothetical protein [Filibacter tadaridae]|uniref:hypothetical protein n=1 Tax=Filibacter tadaridae TaxID=2483811 RepID=UPI0039EAA9BE
MALKEFKEFKNVLKIVANVVFLIGVIISVFILSGNVIAGVYNMSLSYFMLLPAMVFLGDFFNNFRSFSFFLFCTTFVIIISLGSRGTLLCMAVITILKTILINLKYLGKELVFRFCFIGSILLLIIQFEKILT